LNIHLKTGAAIDDCDCECHTAAMRDR